MKNKFIDFIACVVFFIPIITASFLLVVYIISFMGIKEFLILAPISILCVIVWNWAEKRLGNGN